jgi:hypothetical protein
MHELYRERYSNFTVKQLVKRHHYKLCYTVTKLSLQAAGLVAKEASWCPPQAAGAPAAAGGTRKLCPLKSI